MERLLANNVMETVDQIEVVDVPCVLRCLQDAFAGSAVCLPEHCMGFQL